MGFECALYGYLGSVRFCRKCVGFAAAALTSVLALGLLEV